MRKNLIENTMALLGGAGLGAALMFLLDPDLGGERRREMRDTAAEALSGTREAARSTAQSAMDSASNVAKSFAGRIGGYAHELGQDLGERASNLRGRASGLATDAVHSAVDSARGYAAEGVDRARTSRDNLMNRAKSILSRAGRATDVEPSPFATAGGITAGTIGVLAVGAGMMYFLDPARGHGRRAWARDKVFSITRRTGKRARGFGRHVGNRLQGVAAEVARSMPEGWHQPGEHDANAAMSSGA